MRNAILISATIVSVLFLNGCHAEIVVSMPEETQMISTEKQTEIITTQYFEETLEQEPETEQVLHISQLSVSNVDPFYNGVARFKAKRQDIEWKGYTYLDGAYGYIDKQGNVLINSIYTQAPEKYTNPAFVGYTDSTGSYVTWDIGFNEWYNENWSFRFDDTMLKYGNYSNGLFWVYSEDQKLSGNVSYMTYYDVNGNEVFSLTNAEPSAYGPRGTSYSDDAYNNYSNFNEYGYAIVQIDGKQRIIDKSGNIIKLQYAGEQPLLNRDGLSVEDIFVIEFNGAIARVNIVGTYVDSQNRKKNASGDECIYIDFEAKTFSLCADEIHFLGNDLYKCGDNYYYFYSNALTGTIGPALYAKDLSTKILDLNKHPAFEGARVQQVFCSEEGFLCIELHNKNSVAFYTILNSFGEVIMEPTTKVIIKHAFQEGLCVAQDASTGKYGYLDTSGKWALAPMYTSAESFSDGLAKVNDSAFIDQTGKVAFSY